MSTEVIRIVFTVEDIEDEINAIDENRGADNQPPLDRAAAMANVLSWASSIQDAAMQRLYESLDSVIETGQP